MADKKPKPEIGRAGRVEREARVNKIITIVMIIIVSFVVIGGIVVAVDKYLVEPKQTVLTVDDTDVSTRNYQSRVRFIRLQYINLYSQLYEYLQYFASVSAEGSEDILNMYYQQLITLQNNLDNYEYIGYNVILGMADEIILTSEAEKLGISISDEELEKGIQAYFNYYPETEEVISEETLEELEDEIVEDLQDSEEAEDVTETQPEVTPEPTVDLYQQYLDDYEISIENFDKELSFSEEDFKYYIKVQLIAEKIYQEISKDIDTTSPQFSARHILVNDPDLAGEILFNYEETYSWSTIELTYKQDNTTILELGDLGWINEFNQPSLFSAVKDAEIGDVLGPIQTDSGYDIIYIEEFNPDMELSDEDLETKKTAIFENWMTETRLEYEVFYKDDWVSRIPKEPEIPFQMRLR